MNTEWDDLRFFLALRRHGSLRKAAGALGVNHGTVLQRLKKLEDALGARLFDRTRKGLVATEAGLELTLHAEEMEDSFRNVRAAVGGKDEALAGGIRVSLPFALFEAGLSGVLAGFAEHYPGISLTLDVGDRFSRLADLEADISVRMAFAVEDDAIGRRILQYGKTAYATPETCALLSAGDPGIAWLDWKDAEEERPWTGNTGYPDLPLRHNAPEHHAQIGLAESGPYLSLLPCFLGDSTPSLVRVPGATVIPDRSIWLLYRTDLRRTARIRVLREALLGHFRDRRSFYSGMLGEQDQ
ncbi:LysR family transcriptional regulator [Nisaea denitrificans]|uniref:LysR family transcriptional regulator n=1 Tax=Nisaea denitrificans TaxID=390877 RepID=UPI000402BB12|nr:LysR family transcriptional regulator [Nisaea denitrificans]